MYSTFAFTFATRRTHPAEQLPEHVLAFRPVVDPKVPAGHCVHAWDPGVLKEPAGQMPVQLGLLRPEGEPKRPPGQGVHAGT